MIRKAVDRDSHRIAEIHVSSWQDAYDTIIPAEYLSGLNVARREAIWKKVIDESRGPVFVALEDDRIVGFCHVTPSRDANSECTAEITAIYVDPLFWRQGHGRSLCEEVISYACREGFNEITLWVITGNHRAQRFYEQMGFFDDGCLKSKERPGFVLKEVRYRRETNAGEQVGDCKPDPASS